MSGILLIPWAKPVRLDRCSTLFEAMTTRLSNKIPPMECQNLQQLQVLTVTNRGKQRLKIREGEQASLGKKAG